MKYYLDTSIWIDLYEDRKGFTGEPLGRYAHTLMMKIVNKDHFLVISDVVAKELTSQYSTDQIKSMIMPFSKKLISIKITKEQAMESNILAKKLSLPRGDIRHAILARDHDLVMITRDKHFKKLKFLCSSYTPEEIID